MHKTILITGATDGIGLATAKMLLAKGHHLLLHGRNPAKLKQVEAALSQTPGDGSLETYVADLSRMAEVEALAEMVAAEHKELDVLINNAGIYSAPNLVTEEGLDLRFAVNTLAPYLLTQRLLPLLGPKGRVVNLSSAAQASVNTRALAGKVRLTDHEAYAQSKLAITIWSRQLGLALKAKGPAIIAVNPASLLGSKLVKNAFGVAGGDLSIGAEILVRAALSEEFAEASGRYFDNDSRRFAAPHADALDPVRSKAVMQAIEAALAKALG